MKKAIIFDVDGVLVDSEQYYLKRRLDFLRSQGVETKQISSSEIRGASDAQRWELLVPAVKFRTTLKADYSAYTDSHPIQFWNHLVPGVSGGLKWLQSNGIRLAIASAGSLDSIERMLKECDLADCFEVVVSGADLLQNKPSPLVYQQALDLLSLLPQQCIAFEDSERGITAAKKAGIETWAIREFAQDSDQSMADKRFENIRVAFSAVNKEMEV